MAGGTAGRGNAEIVNSAYHRPDHPLVPAACAAGLVVWFAVLWLLSSQPGEGGPEFILPVSDKVLHFGYFFGGGGLMAGVLARMFRERRIVYLVGVMLLAAVGMSDEWHQLSTPGRSGGDVFDWLADVSGAACGMAAWLKLRAFRLRRALMSADS